METSKKLFPRNSNQQCGKNSKPQDPPDGNKKGRPSNVAQDSASSESDFDDAFEDDMDDKSYHPRARFGGKQSAESTAKSTSGLKKGVQTNGRQGKTTAVPGKKKAPKNTTARSVAGRNTSA